MSRVRIAIIDSGIHPKSPCAKCIVDSYVLHRSNNNYTMSAASTEDFVGHGTAVSHILFTVNENIEIISIRICNAILEIDETGLVFALKYIYENIDVDIINISAGVTYLNDFKALDNICWKLHQKGIVIVAAFDNDGAVSFPAALDYVIGVDTEKSFENKNDITFVNNGIVDILVADKYYRTLWLDKGTIIKGTSFACANVTGLLSKNVKDLKQSNDLNTLKRSISNNLLDIKNDSSVSRPQFTIKKAIIFPVNKESHALLRFKDRLKFDITGTYDERLSGEVGKRLFDKEIESFDSIDWNENFDTVILSCTSELTAITKRKYCDEVLEKAKKYNKQIYTFENIDSDYKKLFYPFINADMVPHGNLLKLHKSTIPVVGVFGTSSKQGKFTLQLHLISKLSDIGYKVGFISTEPSGYLFNADYVFHFGYHANLTLQPWECTSILNKMVWGTQLNGKDILVTGCQSGIIHYNDSKITDFAIYQYAFLLGVMPDISILCVNPHDDMDYIKRSIDFINSVCDGKVQAIAIFPMMAVETLSGIGFKTEELGCEEMQKTKNILRSVFQLPTFSMNDDIDLQRLCSLIIDEFCEDNLNSG